MKSAAILALGLCGAVSAVELSPENYDAQTAGKTVFLKFFAPWCGHCKKMKPDWDRLMGDFAGNTQTLVADVDCTASGKPLCDANGVKGFPTLKFGDPAALEDYQGGRDFETLATFAKGLKPSCSPSNIDLCDDAQKANIQSLQALSGADLDAQIAQGEQKLTDAEERFTEEVEKLQKAYQKLQDDKEATIAEVKASGLGLLKAVKASKSEAKTEL